MSTRIRSFYELLNNFSTETQSQMCDDIIRGATSANRAWLVSEFVEAINSNSGYDNTAQPFLGEQARRQRSVLSHESIGDNRIVWLLSSKATVRIIADCDMEVARFRYSERQIAPKRTAHAHVPSSGAGGIDYLGFRESPEPGRPVIGEIKVDSDGNAFYAFVQLLVYLSELATAKQIDRANCHNLFGTPIGQDPQFDLHILLADFNGRGKKVPIIEKTRVIAEGFKNRLAGYPAVAARLGDILCIKMNAEHFATDGEARLQLIWKA